MVLLALAAALGLAILLAWAPAKVLAILSVRAAAQVLAISLAGTAAQVPAILLARGQRGHVYDLLWKMMIAALMGLGSAFGYWMELALSATMAVGTAEW